MTKQPTVTAIADRTLRDMVPVLDRYRPAALAVSAVLVAVAVLPGATQGSESAAPAAFDAGPASDAGGFEDDFTSEPAPTEPSGAVDTEAEASVPEPASPGFTPSAPSSSPSFTPSPAPSPSPSFSPSAPAPSPPPQSSASPSPAAPAPTLATPGNDDAEEPLRITVSGYASTTAGTPVPPDAPDGSLPVGTRVGQTDKASYIRLAGDGSTLVLTEIDDGRRGGDFESSPVQACQITDAGWKGGDNMTFADAPAHDPESCVAVTPQPDGTWSLPLISFADPTDDRGLALVPAPDAPLDFQVTFAAQTAT